VAIITPFDNKVGAWLVAGDQLGETSIDDLAQTILMYAPAVTQVWVKTSDGADWMAKYDSKKAMAIDGPAAIARWVNTLQKYGLEFHAWCVPHGTNITAEANVIVQACKVPGVRSMILDIEPYSGFYSGGQASIRPLMTRILSQIPGSFHMAMTCDSRQAHYNEIFPDEWAPFVKSIHPQVYWADFQNTPEQALADAYKTWGKYYDKPVIPALSGYNTDPALMTRARNLLTSTYHAPGWSWWVLGHMDVSHLNTANFSASGIQVVPPPGAGGMPAQTGTPIVVSIGSPNYHDGTYPGSATTFSSQPSPNGGIGKYKAVDQAKSNVWVAYLPQITQAGFYRIEAYLPAQHASTGNARYKIHGIKEHPGEFVVSVAQCAVSNGWVNLGTYQIDPSQSLPGAVYLDDWTLEMGLEIAWDALRWTPVYSMGGTSILLDVPYRSQESQDASRYRNDCGPACVGMLLDWVKQVKGLSTPYVSTDTLSSKTALVSSAPGLTPEQLVTLAAAYNLNLQRSDQLTLGKITSELLAGRPVLMLIAYGPLTGRENQADTGGHFVIVVGFDANNVYLNDPEWWNNGSQKMSDGHNWKVPMTQFYQAIMQAESPHTGCLIFP